MIDPGWCRWCGAAQPDPTSSCCGVECWQRLRWHGGGVPERVRLVAQFRARRSPAALAALQPLATPATTEEYA